MSGPERDPVTGRMTTGHEWNGIKELNTPVPKIVFWALALGLIYLSVATILLPAWPSLTSYTRGLLGVDQRNSVDLAVRAADLQRSDWTNKIVQGELSALAKDHNIERIVLEVAPALFGDNCAACHGNTGHGRPGYANLVEAPLAWGEDADAIYQTIRFGVNSDHPSTRFGTMLAFGQDGMLTRAEIGLLVDFLLDTPRSDPTGAIEQHARASEVFEFNCTSCHGENGKGQTEFGAPDLTDEYWLFGGDRQAVFWSIYNGRAGHMPHWDDRLSELDIRILALYVKTLRDAAK